MEAIENWFMGLKESFMEAMTSFWLGFLDLSAPALMAGSALGFGLCFGIAYFCIKVLESRIPEDNREFKDPLPASMQPFWPLIRTIAYYVCTNLPIAYLDRLEKKLQQTGVSYMVNAEEFFAIRIISAFFFPIMALLGMWLLESYDLMFFGAAVVLGFFYPMIWLGETKKKRESHVVRALPMYLEFISMSVEAGLNMTGAMSQAVEKGPTGPLKNEFQIVMRDLRAGVSRADALTRLAERLDIKEVNSFVRAVIQAERLGSSMRKVLKVQSEQRRNERFQRAEKQAMEAPVKLLVPLMVFIFPVTFLILAFPIVVKFMDQGFL
jgi:tight adherence protein C